MLKTENVCYKLEMRRLRDAGIYKAGCVIDLHYGIQYIWSLTHTGDLKSGYFCLFY